MAHVFTIGEDVRLEGIKSNPSLNGAIGTVTGDTDFESRGRYNVQLRSPAAAVTTHLSGISLSGINLIKISECAHSECDQVGTKACSLCLKEYYCSGECQKGDWKDHKKICPMIKEMSDVLVPLAKFESIFKRVIFNVEVLKAKLGLKNFVRILEHTLTFVQHQFGKQVAGKILYVRDDIGNSSKWDVEVTIFCEVYNMLGGDIGYCKNSNSTVTGRWTKAMMYFEKSFALLKSWIVQINLSKRDRSSVLTEKMVNDTLRFISTTGQHLGIGYRNFCGWNKSLHYLEQAVIHVKLLKEGEIKTRMYFEILSDSAQLHHMMGNLTESKAVREEAYVSVSAVYDPEHPLVLEAGSNLVKILAEIGDHYDAERFARICYDSLTRNPLNDESYEAADAALNLANLSCALIEENGPGSADIEEAEMLAKKAYRIIKELKGPVSQEIAVSISTLVSVELIKKNYGEETKSVLEDFMSDSIQYEGKDGLSTGHAHRQLGRFYREMVTTLSCDDGKRKHLDLSHLHFKESLRIYIKQSGPSHPMCLHVSSILQEVSTQLAMKGMG